MSDVYIDRGILSTDAVPCDFDVIIEFGDAIPNPALFLPYENNRPLKPAEKEWVREAIADPSKIQEAPSAPAMRVLQRSLEKYDGPMPVSKEQWQNFVMKKYWEQANDIDPKISKPALDALAKTNMVGLHTDVQEININTRATLDIEAELLQTVQKIISKKTALPAETLTDDVLEGEWTE